MAERYEINFKLIWTIWTEFLSRLVESQIIRSSWFKSRRQAMINIVDKLELTNDTQLAEVEKILGNLSGFHRRETILILVVERKL